MSKAAKFALGFYAAVAVVTFGHSAANAETLEECNERHGDAAFNSCITYTSPLAVAVRGVMISAVWPLYWSREIQS